MTVWPLGKPSYETFEDTVKKTFGETAVKINIVDIFNSGFLLYSQREPSPTITVNANHASLLKMMMSRFLKCTIEHEFTHMFGKGKQSSLSINYPETVPISLRKDVSAILNDELQSLINCCIVTSQQKLACQYLDFEFEKILYSLRNDRGLLRASVLIRLGYLSATVDAVTIPGTNWQIPLGPVISKMTTDFFDGMIFNRARNLFECVCQHDYFNADVTVDLNALCLELDESISLQKNYLV